MMAISSCVLISVMRLCTPSTAERSSKFNSRPRASRSLANSRMRISARLKCFGCLRGFLPVAIRES